LLTPLRAALAEQKQERERLETDREEAAEAQQEAENKRSKKQHELAGLEERLRRATPAGTLAELVESRFASDDYRRELGIVSIVRQDFEKMSKLLRDHAERLEQGKADADERLAIGRIVLYIDDLDRCPPRKVVQVLEAVHVLLAFPLFVVVVGVDARWLSRSLAMRHPRQLALDEAVVSDGAAAPRDYLEKIFQVPFWLEPLDTEAARRMLRGLLPRGEARRARPHASADTEPR
jgi:hypothetical protein